MFRAPTVDGTRVPNLMENVAYADDLVKEYLIFRGFSQTFKNFTLEKRHDKTKGFQAAKVVDLLLHHIHSFNLQQLLELWTYLNDNYYQKASETKDLLSITTKLELSLKRYYLVNCVNKGNVDKIKEFYHICGDELASNSEWSDWFALPYMKSPQTHPQLKEYFSRWWIENFQLSLTNFLSTTFHSVPLPKVLSFNSERTFRKMLEEENSKLREEIDRLKKEKKILKNQTDSSFQNVTPIKTKTPEKEVEPIRRPSVVALANMISDKITQNIGKDRDSNRESRESREIVTPRDHQPTTPRNSTDFNNSNNISNNNSNNSIGVTGLGVTSNEGIMNKSNSDIRISGGSSFIVTTDNENKHFNATVQEVYTGHTSQITKCKFSPSGQEIATASNDGIVKIWSMSGGTSKRQSSVFCFSEVLSLSWEAKANKMLFCGTQDGRVKLWNTASEKLVADLKVDQGTPRVLDIISSPNGPHFVTSSTSINHDKASLLCWNMKTFQVESQLPVDPDMIALNSINFNHNGSMIAAGGSDGMIRIYDMSSSSAIMGWKAHDADILSIHFSYDETCVYSLGGDGKICQWSIHRIGDPIQTFDYEGFLPGTNRGADLAFDNRGEYFVVGSKSNHGLIYKTKQSKYVQTVGHGHIAPVVAVDWTNQENYALCATGSLDHTVRISKLEKIL